MSPNQQKAFRRALRNNLTPQENTLWYFLRNRRFGGFKFRRQYSSGPYILDFYCPARRLAIEVDGSGHLAKVRKCFDKRRDLYLKQQGIKIIRIGNNEINVNLAGVLDYIEERMTLTPGPSPCKGEGN